MLDEMISIAMATDVAALFDRFTAGDMSVVYGELDEEKLEALLKN